jgi:hypothetical protein
MPGRKECRALGTLGVPLIRLDGAACEGLLVDGYRTGLVTSLSSR